MKIRFLDRVLLFVGAFITALVGVALVLTGLQTGGLELGGAGASLRVQGWLLVLFGAVLFAFGVYLMSLPAKYRTKKENFVLQQTASGELRISVNAIENLVQKVFMEHQEATLSRLDIQNHRDGVVVDMAVSIADDVSIPLLVSALQKQIKQHLLTAAGVDVKEVRVSVDTAEAGGQPSPYRVEESAAAIAPDAQAEASFEFGQATGDPHETQAPEVTPPVQDAGSNGEKTKDDQPNELDPHEERGN